MSEMPHLSGVYTAAITPLTASGEIDLPSVPLFLQFLARRGCHGALLLGTTGEGPSFAHHERVAMMRAALAVRQEHPDFHLLAGTGTPSLEETVANTRAAFDLGFDGVVVLPPYYYRNATEEGLFAWFSQVIERAVPPGGALLGYHIPAVTGVPLSIELIARLKDCYPDRFAGLKDSSGSLESAQQLGERFGDQLLTLVGNDRIFAPALAAKASGCITAMANLCSPTSRRVWDAHLNGAIDLAAQEQLTAGRAVMDKYPPAPPPIKSLLSQWHNFPRWTVRPPLLDIPAEVEARVMAEMAAVFHE
jgi:4-hydroxy-tetrahydrodipicolinate synthase